jgi:toxin CptA
MRLSIPYIDLRPRAAGAARDSINTAFILALLFAVALPLLWLSLIAAPTIHIEVGEWGDDPFLSGVNKPEQNATETYRWTGKHAELVLPNLGSRYQLLRVRAHGWRPPGNPSPKVRIAVAGQTLATIQTTPVLHTYNILLPPDNASPALKVDFTSDLYRDTADRRDLGFAIDWVELNKLDQNAGPAWWQLGGQAALLLLVFVLLYMLALPRGWAIGSAVILTLALLGANAWQPLWVGIALPGWLVIAALLPAATWLIGPWLARQFAHWMTAPQAHVAWALFVAALALRLLGATHPLFEIHDLGFHRNWITDVTQGQLYIFSTPSEFQNRATFNPPDGYFLLLPLRLLTLPTRLVLQVGLALVDAIGGLLLLALGRELGLTARAGLLVLALYAAMPINMTMMWWGFTTNALAQAVGLLLFWLLLRLVRRPEAGRQAAFAAACAAGFLMHIGALVLIVALLGACIVLGWWHLGRAERNAAIGLSLLALACTGLFYFSAVVPASLGQSASASGVSPGELLANNWAIRDQKLNLIWLGLIRGFLPIPLALAPLGFVRMLKIQPRHPIGRTLIVGWLAVCLLFFGVYIGLGLVVRFLYFATPLLALWLGALFDTFWQHRGRLVVLVLILLVAWSGVTLWAAGVLMGVKPSGVPLTY